jgi:ABC-type dipeptide/oligopeptide/nickel transport system permease subunit
MSQVGAVTGEFSSEKVPHISETRRVIKVFFSRKISVVGLCIILLLFITGIFAPWLAPYDPYKTDARNNVKMPSREHLLGTDNLGRDTLSRIIYGARTSLILGVSIIAFGSIVGIMLGLIAGYGGWLTIIMRFTDAWMCFPPY